jgi:hypothetical protein
MNLFRKLTLAVVAVVFCFGLFTVTTSAQGRGNHRGWSKHNKVQIQYGNPVWNRRQARLSPQELRRLQRERYRIYRSTNRAYRDGSINSNERRRLSRQRDRFRRHVYRDRHDRN